MKNLKIYFVLFVSVVIFAGCTRIGPGYVGIKVNMAGSDKGVESYPVKTGWQFYNPATTNILEYPTFVQTAAWTHDANEGSPNNEEISFNSKEGLIINADISLSYKLAAERVPYFYVKFRNDDINIFTHGFLRNVARDMFNETGSKYSVEDIYGPKKEQFLSEVRKKLETAVADIGVQIEQFGFIGAPRPPQNVIDAINAKIAATQNAMRSENELRQSEAEARKKIAIAEGEAKANSLRIASLTPQMIDYERMMNERAAIAKWDGKLPDTMVPGSSLPFINLKKDKEK